MRSFTLAAITASACNAISLQAKVEEGDDDLHVYFDHNTQQWMEQQSTELATIIPTYDSSSNRWVYQDDDGNTFTVDPADGPPFPSWDQFECRWMDGRTGELLSMAVGGDPAKQPFV